MIQCADWLGYHLLKKLQPVFSRMSLPKALALGRLIGTFAYWFSPRRTVAYADLKAVFRNERSEKDIHQIVRSLFRHMGQMFVETLRMPSIHSDYLNQHVEAVHYERFEDAARSGRGTLFVTAHMGNWELCQLLSGHYGRPIHVVGQAQKHTRLNDYLRQLRESHGTKALEVGAGVRGVFKALREGKAVGILGDNSPGRDQGTVLPFLGRKTAFATGAFEIAQRTQSPLLPCFMIRTHDTKHQLHFESLIEVEQSPEGPAEAAASYLQILERFIRQHPDQWLWTMKRWKYSWTKRVLILSDGKPGHEKQSRAVFEHLKTIDAQYGRPGLEFPLEVIQVQFRSAWHRRLFSLFAAFFIPWAQGRLGVLRFFFQPECFNQILRSSADIVLSAGASLAPLNLCLARDSRAKSIILMNPGLPFSLYPIDLALVPAHDHGLTPKRSLRLHLTPSQIDLKAMQRAADLLKPSLRAPEKIKFAVFLGGETRQYKMAFSAVEFFYSTLQRIAQKYGDYMITTSRRTPEGVTQYLKQRVFRDGACQLFVDARVDRRPEVVGGMMAIAEYLIVTEDSISMISEAVATGKKVIVITFADEHLPAKHRRFKKLLAAKGAIQILTPSKLEAALNQNTSFLSAQNLIHEEADLIRKKLQEML